MPDDEKEVILVPIKMTREMIEFLDNLQGTSRAQKIKDTLYRAYPDMPQMQKRGKYRRASKDN